MQPSLWQHGLILLLCLVAAGGMYAQKKGIDSSYITWSKNMDQIQDKFEKDQHHKVRELVVYNVDYAKKIYSPESKEYRSSIYYLAQLYEKDDKFESAEQTYKKTEQLFIQMKDSLSLDYGILLRQMGHFYQEHENYHLADSLLHQAIDIIAATKGKRHEEYAVALNYLGNLYVELGEYDEAIQIYEQIGKRFQNLLDPFDYMSLMIDLGYAYEIKGMYEDALECYLKCENIQGRKNKDLANASDLSGILAIALGGQARTYEELGNYNKAEEKFFQANAIYSKTGKAEGSIAAHNHRILLEDFAAFYARIGAYEDAKEIYNKLSSSSSDPLLIASNKNSLGMLYEAMGDYPKAEQYYLEAKEIYDNTPQRSLDHYGHANTLSNLAGLYELIGKYKVSERFYLKAKEIDGLTIGRDHPDYAATINNLAKLYTSLGKYEEAEKYFEDAQHILNYSIGKHHPNYIKTLSNKASLFMIMERYEEAEELLEIVLKTQQKLLGNKHPDYATTLGQIAGLHKQKGNIPRAMRFYQKALKLRKAILGEKHPAYAAILNEFGQLHHYAGNRDEALEYFLASNAIFLDQLRTIYPILSEQERLRFFARQEPHFEAFYSFASDYLAELPSLALELQNIHIQIKGLALETTINAKHSILSNGDDELRSLFREWSVLRDEISQVYSLSLSEQQQFALPLDSLIAQANELEAQLSKRSSYFKNKRQQENQQIDFYELQRCLGDQEVVIDFMQFRYYNGRSYSEEIRYYAFITHKGAQHPQWVRLSNEKEISRFLDRSMAQRSSNYATDQRIAYWLYRRIWEPLTPFLNNIKVVHICPAGLLHKISFGALMPDSTFLIDHYEIAYHSHLRDLARDSVSSQTVNQQAVLLGDPAFSTAPGHLRKQGLASNYEVDDKGTTVPISILQDKAQRGYFNPLAGTGQEVTAISYLLDSMHWQMQIHLQERAMEERIKELSHQSKPHILHIATHGYFFPRLMLEDSVSLRKSSFQDRLRYTINPLWRSGLAFAGANYVWRGSTVPSQMEDGVLMAYEVANLDLFGVGLVVLSACDTGRGDLHNSEGVLGLQRAFKAAGVRHLILSLWRIPDEQTSELMLLFYQNYLQGQSVRKAFGAAQRQMAKKYAPFYWAGFILVE